MLFCKELCKEPKQDQPDAADDRHCQHDQHLQEDEVSDRERRKGGGRIEGSGLSNLSKLSEIRQAETSIFLAHNEQKMKRSKGVHAK